MSFDIAGTVIGTLFSLMANKFVEELNNYRNMKEHERLVNEFFWNAIEKIKIHLNGMSLESYEKLIKEKVENSFKKALNTFDANKALASLKTELEPIFNDIGLTKEESSNLIEILYDEDIDFIKENHPIEYEQYMLEGIKDKIDSSNKSILVMNDQLKILLKDYGNYLSPLAYEIQLKNTTSNPSLDLNYFKIDDEAFENIFLEKVNEGKNIYIRCFDKEEAVGCLLYSFKKHITGKKILVVNNLLSWNQLYGNVSGYILIANFDGDVIPPILNNQCIYLLDKQDNRADALQLKKRKSKTIKECLHSYKIPTERVVQLMEETNGFYFVLHHLLYSGQEEIYKEIIGDYENVKPFLFFSEWEDNCDDINEIRNFFRLDKSNVFEKIKEYQNLKHPVLVKKQTFIESQNRICLTSPDVLWTIFWDRIELKEFKRYLDFVSNLIVEFTTKKISKTLIFNCLRFISFMVNQSINNKHEIYEKLGNSFVLSVLEKAFNEKKAEKVISEYYISMVEIGPDSYVEFLYKHHDWLLESINAKVHGFPFYTSIIQSFEEILPCQSKSINEIFSFTQDIDEKVNYNASFSPKPNEIIALLVIPWMNFTSLSIKERIEILTNYLEENKWAKLWDYILNGLIATNGPLMGVGLRYRPHVDVVEASNEDYYQMLSLGADLLLKYARDKQYIQLLNEASYLLYDENKVNTIVDKIQVIINNSEDIGKFEYEMLLREYVYDVVFYQRNTLKRYPHLISRLKEVIINISYENKSFKFLFIILSGSKEKIFLDPEPYEGPNSYDYQKREETIKKEIVKQTQIASDNGVSISDLIGLFYEYKEKDRYYDFIDIVTIMTGSKFDVSVFNVLKDNNRNDAVFYLRRCNLDNKTLIELANSVQSSLEKALFLAGSCLLNRSFLQLVFLEDEEIKSFFLQQWDYRYIEDKDALNEVENALKSTNVSLLINCLITCMELEKITLRECVIKVSELLSQSPNLIDYKSLSNLAYQMRKVRGMHDNDFEFLKCCSKIELFADWSDYDLYFTNLLLLKDHALFIDLFESAFKRDQAESKGYRNKANISWLNLFYRFKQCPGYSGKIFNQEEFLSWMAWFDKWCENSDYLKAGRQFKGKIIANAYQLNTNPILPFEQCVCEYLEESYSEALGKTIENSIYNLRGLHSIGDGYEERQIANKYSTISDTLKKHHFYNCAKIFDNLQTDYLIEANRYQEIAKYE